MPWRDTYTLFEAEQVGRQTIVRFTASVMVDEDAIAAAGRQLCKLAESPARRQIVVDFAGVDRVTTFLIGKLVELHKQLQASGGRLALCNVGADLQGVFKVLGLHRVLRIYAGQQEALQSFP
jgi:anti-anti-sigma factor